MPATPDLTVPQKLIVAGYRLEQRGQNPFTAEALVVQAWKDSPRTFGLAGFADQYPDANKALASLMGEKGLVRRGWFVQPVKGSKLYHLSDQARAEVRRIQSGTPTTGPVANGHTTHMLPKIQVSESCELAVCSLLRLPAYSKFRGGQSELITWPDAEAFVSLGPTEAIRQTVAALVNGRTTMRCGAEVTRADLDSLTKCEQGIRRVFKRQLQQKAAAR